MKRDIHSDVLPAPVADVVPVMSIKRRPRDEPPDSYDGLRAAGISHIQTLCAQTWTDHNLHDPGITMLEALCYGLSELAHRAELPVADHLAGERDRIDFARQSLHPPQQVFPCRPTTLADYRRILIDALDGEGSVAIDVQPRSGLYQVAMHAPGLDAQALERGKQALRRAFRRQRNLCEDIDDEIIVVKDAPCMLLGEVEIGSAHDPARIVADIHHACARHVASPVSFESIDEAARSGRTPDALFEGPSLQNGFIGDDDMAGQDRDVLFVGDLVEAIKKIHGVVEVRSLGLRRLDAGPDAPMETGSLPWRWGQGRERRALRLLEPGLQGVTQEVRLLRRGSPVDVPLADVLAKLEEAKAASHSLRHRAKSAEAVFAMPTGRRHDLASYHSVQHHFPAVYGINAHGLPATADDERRAQAKQLKAYLMLFEQTMAHATMQMEHVRDLFSAFEATGRSRWWHMLDDEAMPGLGDFYIGTPEAILREVYEPLDRHAERKSRALDHLLALNGASCPQRTMRQFADFLTAAELDSFLFENKVAFVKDVLAIGRDRAGGFDDTLPLHGLADNRSGLERRASLLLGFRPRLSPWMSLHGQAPDAPAPLRVARRLKAGVSSRQWVRLLPAPPGVEAGPMPGLRGDAASAAEPPAELMRAGIHAGRFWWNEGAGRRGQVIVGPDEQGDHWQITNAMPHADAVRVAAGIRQWLLAQDQTGDGMHVVEHLLLRKLPAGPGDAVAEVPDAFVCSVVFAAWTARGKQDSFRRFAHETMVSCCPAHVHPRCLWLDRGQMQHFERLYQRWLSLRIRHAANAGAGKEALNAAAADLLQCLRSHPAEGEVGL